MIRRPARLSRSPVGSSSRGRWNKIEAVVAGPSTSAALFVTQVDEHGTLLSGRIYLRARRRLAEGRRHFAVCYVFERTAAIELSAICSSTEPLKVASLECRAITRWSAAAQLLARTPSVLLGVCDPPLPTGLAGAWRRAREVVAELAVATQQISGDYADWIKLFDTWSPGSFEPHEGAASIGFLVLARAGSSAALAGTVRSIEQQYDPTPHVVFADGDSREHLEAGLAGLGTDYVGVLQAGEVLPPHATSLARIELDRLGRPTVAIADEDEVTLAGVRHSPAFRPSPNRLLMLSGTLSRGLWLVRRATLGRSLEPLTASAEELRLRVWLRCHAEETGEFSRRIPFILAHRRPDAETAPPCVIAAVVNAHLSGRGAAIEARATWPVTFSIKDGVRDRKTTAVIPSTLKRPHSLACITDLLCGTDHDDLEVIVAVAQAGPLDEEQAAAAAEISSFRNARVLSLHSRSFNFSWVNNRVIERTAGEDVLLLNDDVSPLSRDWLRWMAAFLRDPDIGVVGARLLYPTGRVQHGGVIMGLAGLTEHAHRDLPGSEPGYMWRAVLAQEVSAVTGACMLVRRRLLERIGGLDERYPSAFNDIDIALKIGELGYSVAYVPNAELQHFELQTYGSHYAHERAPFEKTEADRFHARWAEVVEADPYHSPNLSLRAGEEWHLAFPPRV